MRELAKTIAAASVLQVVTILVVFAMSWLATSFFRRVGIKKIQERSPSPAVVRGEIKFTIINTVASLGLIASTIYLHQRHIVKIAVGEISIGRLFLQSIIYFLCMDIYTYAVHRIMHTRYLYKKFHSVHHRSRVPHVLTSFSFHPVEWLSLGIFFPLVLIIYEFHIYTIVLVSAIQFFTNTLPHCGYEYAPRWWYKNRISKWFLTAFYHDVHHQEASCNYGTVTTVWDHLLGTVPKDFEARFAAMKARTSGPPAPT